MRLPVTVTGAVAEKSCGTERGAAPKHFFGLQEVTHQTPNIIYRIGCVFFNFSKTSATTQDAKPVFCVAAEIQNPYERAITSIVDRVGR